MSAEIGPIDGVVLERDEQLSLSDGIQLTARLWYSSHGGPWPALLMRQPYGRCIASTVTIAHPAWWVRQGYLVVVQDVRGQGDSGGQFTGFEQEAADAVETHAWVRALPECNGRMGCYGFSYQGLTQLLALADAQPPDCMAPAMAGLDERRHWSSEGGAHWWHLGLGWGLQLAALQARRAGQASAWERIHRALEDGSYLRDGLQLLAQNDPEGMVHRWLTQDPGDSSGWRHYTVPPTWLRQPMLLLGGWWDPHLIGILDLWNRAKAAGGSPELHIGPATHLQWWPEAQTLMRRFFDQHLKQGQAANAGLQIWDCGAERWRTTIQACPANWSLQGTGLACLDTASGQLVPAGEGRGEERVVHDPWRPVPAIGGHLSPSPGLADRHLLDQRADVATFTSLPLEKALRLEGQPQLLIHARADQPGFDLCVALSRLPAATQEVIQISTGVLRVLGPDAQHAGRRRVFLQPLLTTLGPGDRLRVSIAGAAWPAIGVNPGSPDHPSGAPTATHRVVSMTLELADSELSLNPLNSGKLCVD